MSEFGPKEEHAPFDYDLAYGSEQETVYTDASLLNLLYVESPAYTVTAADVKAKIDFAEDDTTETIIAEANGDATLAAAIQKLQRDQINTARLAFAYLDAQPWGRKPIPDIEAMIERFRPFVDSFDVISDPRRAQEAAFQLEIMENIATYRKDSLEALEELTRTIESQQNIPLEFAVQAITQHVSRPPESPQTPAD